MSSTPFHFRVENARDEDLPRCMEVVLEAFGPFPIIKIMGGSKTPENYEFTAGQHLTGFREHAAKYPSVWPAIKCVHTDPATGEEKIIGYAEWFVWDRVRSEEEYMQENHILRMEWIQDEEKREKCLEMIQPEVDMRRTVMKGRPFALLGWMCVDPAYRRRGVASACVRWGMERCAELGIPAYLEASEEGMKTYKSLGWEVFSGDGVEELAYPPMIWWPPNAVRN
ncbi:hypothetical protein ACHAO4_003151 [Trichoderma viride]